ncbi:hypothetical protein PT974_05041 [Cladobotryum mycophilum]|uniref:Uncharacterized protein n=1 Tax=Cladobotryum mycophilum TaxID=491253 RepID=A0ABR0SRK6_9HYPO
MKTFVAVVALLFGSAIANPLFSRQEGDNCLKDCVSEVPHCADGWHAVQKEDCHTCCKDDE